MTQTTEETDVAGRTVSMFARKSDEQLRRDLHFHENDNGTMTMREEMRRMWFVQEITSELARRSTS